MKENESILSQINGFGKTFKLIFDHKKRFTSSTGGLFTIITYLLVISTIWLFGKEMIYKEKPILVNQYTAARNRPNLTLKLNTSYTVEDHLGMVIPNYHKFVTFTATLVNITLAI